MEFEAEKAHALAILRGIEQAEHTPDESFTLLDAEEPVFVYLILKWIKKHYHRDHDLFEVMRGRLATVTNAHRSLTRKAKSGEDDPIVEWFEGTYKYRDLPAEEFIDLIVEKLEG